MNRNDYHVHTKEYLDSYYKPWYCNHCGIEIKDKSSAWSRAIVHYCSESCLKDSK